MGVRLGDNQDKKAICLNFSIPSPFLSCNITTLLVRIADRLITDLIGNWFAFLGVDSLAITVRDLLRIKKKLLLGKKKEKPRHKGRTR